MVSISGIYILAIPPKLKIREEFEGGLHEKKEGKRGGKKKTEKIRGQPFIGP